MINARYGMFKLNRITQITSERKREISETYAREMHFVTFLLAILQYIGLQTCSFKMSIGN